MTFRVNKRSRTDGRIYWRLIHESWKDGARVHQHIPVEQYLQHGFKPDMTPEEAKNRASQLNALGRLDRADERKKLSALRFAKDTGTVKSAHLPEALVVEFLPFLREEIAIGPTGEKKYSKALSHWEYVKRAVATVKLPPSLWYDSRRRFYDYFAKQESSPDYLTKILRVLNLWGTFQARKTGQSFIPIPAPRGYDREMVADAYDESDKRKKTSFPLTPELLEAARGKLSEQQYNWLYLSVWLGLRPMEIDTLMKNSKLTKEQGVKVLWVYQSKLRGVKKEDRYKPIPLICKEQDRVFDCIKRGTKRPLVKTVQKFVHPEVNLYGGRKAFTDLMLSKGQSLEDISAWLGHTSIERTWKSYKQRQKVSFKKVS